ncbi:MAG: hypothetical protein ACOC33_03415 [bacterium]
MKKEVEKTLNDFIENSEEVKSEKDVKSRGKAARIIDSTLIMEDGRQLLREHY